MLTTVPVKNLSGEDLFEYPVKNNGTIDLSKAKTLVLDNVGYMPDEYTLCVIAPDAEPPLEHGDRELEGLHKKRRIDFSLVPSLEKKPPESTYIRIVVKVMSKDEQDLKRRAFVTDCCKNPSKCENPFESLRKPLRNDDQRFFTVSEIEMLIRANPAWLRHVPRIACDRSLMVWAATFSAKEVFSPGIVYLSAEAEQPSSPSDVNLGASSNENGHGISSKSKASSSSRSSKGPNRNENNDQAGTDFAEYSGVDNDLDGSMNALALPEIFEAEVDALNGDDHDPDLISQPVSVVPAKELSDDAFFLSEVIHVADSQYKTSNFKGGITQCWKEMSAKVKALMRSFVLDSFIGLGTKYC